MCWCGECGYGFAWGEEGEATLRRCCCLRCWRCGFSDLAAQVVKLVFVVCPFVYYSEVNIQFRIWMTWDAGVPACAAFSFKSRTWDSRAEICFCACVSASFCVMVPHAKHESCCTGGEGVSVEVQGVSFEMGGTTSSGAAKPSIVMGIVGASASGVE